MAFTQLSEYSEGSLPECGPSVRCHYCSNAMSYKPIDVSGLSAAVAEQFQAASDKFSEVQETITNQVKNLDEEWGKKFAMIDGSDLGIVDVGSFRSELSNVKSSINDQQSSCESLINSIVSKTEAVNQYLSFLEETYQEFKQYEQEHDGLIVERDSLINQCNSTTDQATINSLNAEIADVTDRIQNLEELLSYYVDIHEPEGSWVLG